MPAPVLRLIAAALAFAPLGAAAAGFDPEQGLPFIRNFLPEAYRGHSQVFATVRAPDGVMYFGTYGAVVSFDGERWRQFPLPGTWTRTLNFGPDGLLYIGGGGMLGRLEPAPGSGELRFVSLVERLPENVRGFASVWSAATEGDTVLCGIDGALLAWRGGEFTVRPFPGQRPALRAAGAQLFLHVGDQLLRWHGGNWLPFARDSRLGAARRLTVLPAEGGVLVALDSGVILRAAPDGALAPWPTPIDEFLRRAGLRNGLRLADGSYLFSTAGEGLVQLAADGAPVRRLTAASGLANTATYGLAIGHGDRVWAETANGLSAFDPLSPWSLFDARNGRPDAIGGRPIRLGGEFVLTMSDVSSQRLVPAPDALGAARLETWLGAAMPGSTVGVMARGGFIVIPESGVVLTGTERALVRLDGGRRDLHPLPSPCEDLLAMAALPGIVAVGMLRGLELVRIAPDFPAARTDRVPGFELEVTNIVELPGRVLWAGTTSGIALRLRLRADGTIAEHAQFSPAHGLGAEKGWLKMHVLQGELIVAQKSGVYRFAADGRFTPDPRFAKTIPAGINTFPIESDGQRRMWFQVRRPDGGFELGRLDLGEGGADSWTPLPEALNAALGFGGANLIVRIAEGGRELLWISGTRSTVRLDLGAPLPTPAPPAAVISEIARGTHRWRPGAATLALPFSREPLRLLFASPAAVAAAVTYETRLLGYDSAWTPAAAPEVNYTNLFGGPFILEVRARDALGRTGEVARAAFTIAPPWHRSAAAYVLYALAAVSAVLGFVRWRLARAGRERRRLENLVAVRTTELAAARDAAEAASRAKSAFLASMSHELRTPLNGVIGYAQLLQGDARLAADQRERIRIVHQSGEHLLRMINDVLDLAKIEAGKIELRPAPFAVRELLDDLCAAHQNAAAAKRLAFHRELAADLPAWVEGDAQKLRQVLDNLIGNAVKFTSSGSVTLRVSQSAGSVSQLSTLNSQPHGEGLSFAVHDTGPGIAAADQARLFQPFEQARTARPNAPGTGLGLAISRALVARMGGTLALASEPGRGSVFSFSVTLPVHAGAPRPETPAITGYEGPRRRVLVVDDHAVNRSLLTDLLGPLGFVCDEADSGEAAIARLTSAGGTWPDLAIVDLRMEGMDGLELTRRLRAQPRGAALRVLLTSASVISFDAAEARAAGCDDFLPKPFRTADLIGKLGALLALRWVPAATTDSRQPFGTGASTRAPLPEAARAVLRDALAQGDLEAFRAALARVRAEHPADTARWDELDEAAAGFQLPRLRQLLDLP